MNGMVIVEIWTFTIDAKPLTGCPAALEYLNVD